MPDGRQRLDRARRDGVDADLLGAEIGGEIANRHLQRRLGDAHDVVVRNPFLAAVVGQRQQRAAVRHHLLGALSDGHERIAGDQHRLAEIVRRGVDVAAIELLLVGEGDGVHHEVERAPGLLRGREHGVDGRRIGHVAMAEHLRADLLRQRLDALLQRIALVGEGNVGALGAAGPGDAPGQRPVVGDPQDQTALAAHET